MLFQVLMDLFSKLHSPSSSPRRQGAVKRHTSCPSRGSMRCGLGKGAQRDLANFFRVRRRPNLERRKSFSLEEVLGTACQEGDVPAVPALPLSLMEDQVGPGAQGVAEQELSDAAFDLSFGEGWRETGAATETETQSESDGDFPSEQLTLESKFLRALPLYQEYWLQCLQQEMQRRRQRHHSLPQLAATLAIPSLLSCSLTSLTTPTATSSLPQPPSHSRSLGDDPCCFWQELPEVRESGLLDSMTLRQKRQQEAMFELIVSEASYLKSLTVVVNHFLGSSELRQALQPLELHTLFSNLPRVREVSQRKSNEPFLAVVRRLESAPLCQRQNLKSFLVLPFQRITRLRIILENILNFTPHDSEIVEGLQRAIAAVHEIVEECNSSVSRMRQTEELVLLEKLMDFSRVKLLPLISRGRWLVREGTLQQVMVEEWPGGAHRSRVSLRAIHLHLFNDLLLLSHREEGRFVVEDYAGPSNVRAEHLAAKPLGLPSESFLLHMSHTTHPTAIILHTSNSAVSLLWQFQEWRAREGLLPYRETWTGVAFWEPSVILLHCCTVLHFCTALYCTSLLLYPLILYLRALCELPQSPATPKLLCTALLASHVL
ncbi:rho guanine nucleotide exchange factor 19 isoform X5 [Amia ocellicauda]|uniref:rho guanine nucleotide exchange factor 19 isoform X5 n=1 Tax=Amia ocellicauda TaxID=2972642 RepID=UPI00346471D3